jgi:hypothetical protein
MRIIKAGILDDVNILNNSKPGAELFAPERIAWVDAVVGEEGQVRQTSTDKDCIADHQTVEGNATGIILPNVVGRQGGTALMESAASTSRDRIIVRPRTQEPSANNGGGLRVVLIQIESLQIDANG